MFIMGIPIQEKVQLLCWKRALFQNIDAYVVPYIINFNIMHIKWDYLCMLTSETGCFGMVFNNFSIFQQGNCKQCLMPVHYDITKTVCVISKLIKHLKFTEKVNQSNKLCQTNEDTTFSISTPPFYLKHIISSCSMSIILTCDVKSSHIC